MDYLDLRNLADDWATKLPLCEDSDPEDVRECETFEDLCTELGCDATPEGLRAHADSVDPTLIPESEFEDYARELAEDIGAINGDAGWPTNCIDWGRAARELQADYSTVDYNDTTYLIRS